MSVNGGNMIKAMRLDERLIHGQVAVTWTTTLQATHIIVANDEVAKDDVQKVSLKMAAPGKVKVAIKPVQDAIKLIQDPRMENITAFVLVKRPEDALTLLEAIPELPYLNIGNFGMINMEGRKQYATSFAATPEEVEIIKKIIEIKPDSNYQMTPSNPPELLKNILK